MGLPQATGADLAPSYHDPGLFVYGAHGHILIFSIGHDGVHLALVGLPQRAHLLAGGAGGVHPGR